MLCGTGTLDLKSGYDSFVTWSQPSNYLLALNPMGTTDGVKTYTVIVKYDLYTSDNMKQEYDFKVDIPNDCVIVTHAASSAAPTSNIMFYFGSG